VANLGCCCSRLRLIAARQFRIFRLKASCSICLRHTDSKTGLCHSVSPPGASLLKPPTPLANRSELGFVDTTKSGRGINSARQLMMYRRAVLTSGPKTKSIRSKILIMRRSRSREVEAAIASFVGTWKYGSGQIYGWNAGVSR